MPQLFSLLVCDIKFDFISQGPPLAGRYDMGAICLQEHSERLQSLVNDASEEGAEIVARGSFGHIGEGAVDQFFPPTVLVNVKHTMNLMQEEVVKSLNFVSTRRLHKNSLKKEFYFSELHLLQ